MRHEKRDRAWNAVQKAIDALEDIDGDLAETLAEVRDEVGRRIDAALAREVNARQRPASC